MCPSAGTIQLQLYQMGAIVVEDLPSNKLPMQEVTGADNFAGAIAAGRAGVLYLLHHEGLHVGSLGRGAGGGRV